MTSEAGDLTAACIPAPAANLPRVLAIVGTTASGKSDLAIALAQELGNAEIVSADSRQVYRGLDLGSGKVSAAERARVPHHLLDVADVVDRRFTVTRYQELAYQAIEAIHAREKVAILVGGTGLYVRAVLDNSAFPAVPADAALRASLEAQPLEVLVARLSRLDPEGVLHLDLKNPRRVVRALEVALITGVPLSVHHQRQPARPARVRAVQLGLTWAADELRHRINSRVAARLGCSPSMLDEVRGLLASGVPDSRLIELGLEYRFLTRHLLGQLTYSEMIEQLQRAIYQFSRRQLTWFNADRRIHWLAPGELAHQVRCAASVASVAALRPASAPVQSPRVKPGGE